MVGSSLKTTLIVVTASAPVALGQAFWPSNQINTSICHWPQLRTAVLRDTLYLDGGDLWWRPGLSNGEYGAVVNDNNPLGTIWMLNFSKPFTTAGNFSAVLEPLYAAGGQVANNIAPNYQDGALLHNDEEFFLFGGLLTKTASLSDPPGNSVRAYRKYSSKVDGLQPGFITDNLDNNITRYVTYGGGVSAPSENRAWYFSGYRSNSSGPIYVPSGATKATTASQVANQLITLDMTTQQKEDWSVKALPSFIQGRANPEVVWVPVGDKGILVALGGVVDADYFNMVPKSSNEANSRASSPKFMSTIDIYDVAGDKWYQQPTTGGPGQLTRGCAVVAPAQDGSSFNIYYYGGYDGLGLGKAESYSDDVWVLSLPSFTWTKLAAGTKKGRAGHKCVMPYPDQMLVIGGNLPLDTANTIPCLSETVRVFNLSTGAWVDRYDPAVWSKYAVPEAVRNKIGGSPTGGATATTPSPSWSATALAAVFATTYPASKITTFYPYTSVAPVNNTNPLAPDTDKDSKGGVPKYLAPVLGVVLGLVFITMIVVAVLLWRRRRLLRNGGTSEAGTEDAGKRIVNWIRNQETKSPATVTSSTTEYFPGSNTDVESSVGQQQQQQHQQHHHHQQQQSMGELMNTEVVRPVELMDTSAPAELHDTPLSHVDVIKRYSSIGETPVLGRGAINNGSFYSSTGGTQQIDHASTISHPVSAIGGPASTPSPAPVHPGPPPIPLTDSSPIAYRPDSDALGNPIQTPTSATGGTSSTAATASTARANIVSGFSQISDRDKSHLRQISDATVSSVHTSGMGHGHSGSVDNGGRILSPTTVPEGEEYEGDDARARFTTSPAVVSPPTASGGGFGMLGHEAGDYLSARGPGGAGAGGAAGQEGRKSVFSESLDDMGGASGKK